MTPRKLIWKELWQRPTAMATCLLAIMLGVTALVAIRSVTVYSEKTVAKQMSELGANILLLPKNASLQDYYAADANGETIPEEYGTQLLLADLPGVEHIAPKLSMQTECNGHTVTLTGILPQSEFDAQAEWKGVQAFNKSCDKCSKRVVLDDGNRSAAEGLAKGRFVSEIAKDEVIVGADAAQLIGATAGGKISLARQVVPRRRRDARDRHARRWPRVCPPAHGSTAGESGRKRERHRNHGVLRRRGRRTGRKAPRVLSEREGADDHASGRHASRGQSTDDAAVVFVLRDSASRRRGQHRRHDVRERIGATPGNWHADGAGGDSVARRAAVPRQSAADRPGGRRARLRDWHGARRLLGPKLGRRGGAAGSVAGRHFHSARGHGRARVQLFAGATRGADRSLSLFP